MIVAFIKSSSIIGEGNEPARIIRGKKWCFEGERNIQENVNVGFYVFL